MCSASSSAGSCWTTSPSRKGTHNIKFGVDYNLIPLTADFTVNFGGIYDFGSCLPAPGAPALDPVQAYGAGLPQYLVQGVGNPHLAFNNNTLGFFVQDSWRMTPRLTVNYGLRYDVEFLPSYAASTALAGSGLQDTRTSPRVFRPRILNFQPRIGLAYDIFGDGKTVGARLVWHLLRPSADGVGLRLGRG